MNVTAIPVNPRSLIDPDLVKIALGPRADSLARQFFRETDSTNDLARAYLAAFDAGARTALFSAESQRAGRGRHGRSWHSPESANLLFSLALPARAAHGLQPQIANLAAAEAVCAAIESIDPSLRATIKWPNDVYLQDKKIAGILAETVSGDGLVLGMGVNVNSGADAFPEELRARAGSLYLATGRLWPRELLLGSIVRRILEWLDSPEPARSESARGAWRERCAILGREVRARQGDRVIAGIALDIDADGALVLESPDGSRIRLLSGEVTFSARGEAEAEQP